MISATVFYARQEVCKTCEFWRGACLKGHALQGLPGCPLKKFEGVDGAGYQEDKAQPEPQTPEGCCGAKKESALAPMAWPEVWRHLMAAMTEWRKAGFPMVNDEVYGARISTCKSCPKNQYVWFQCRHCRCVIYTKAKLATETCPFGLWPG